MCAVRSSIGTLLLTRMWGVREKLIEKVKGVAANDLIATEVCFLLVMFRIACRCS